MMLIYVKRAIISLRNEMRRTGRSYSHKELFIKVSFMDVL